MSHLIISKFSKRYEDQQEILGYDPNMCSYINTIVAYNFLYNDYIQDRNSTCTELSQDAEQKWQGLLAKLENNIKSAFQILVINKSKFVEHAMQILEETIINGSCIAISGSANNNEKNGTKPLLRSQDFYS